MSTTRNKVTKVTVSFTLTTEYPESVIGDDERCPLYECVLSMPLYGWYQVTDFQIEPEHSMSVNGVVKLAP